ncbi:hypothetical protein LF41_1758 [Lysobacter dokdonensis DS-58]|uniref:Uncharacterized protein n=1 Tax=Lysobacter dokdonensis DS-58 TaxID=1300345 RepID=A0A0A2WXZ2_9GAMM|nr:hypothetical protein LF41_1758 [Lysobacter dokdonensis DS-58]
MPQHIAPETLRLSVAPMMDWTGKDTFRLVSRLFAQNVCTTCAIARPRFCPASMAAR